MVPPLVTAAVKVMFVLGHTDVDDVALIVMEGVETGLVVTLIEFETAEQPPEMDTITS